MKTKEKYETPLSTQMLMEAQGVLAASYKYFTNDKIGVDEENTYEYNPTWF